MLVIDDLSVSFRQYRGAFGRRYVRPLQHISLALRAGEILALVGESGAGKSLLADAILGLLPGNAEVTGAVTIDPTVKVSYIPQCVEHFDPTMRIGHFIGLTRPNPEAALKEFGLAAHVAKQYPHELSGGMLRRATLATVPANVGLLVADEPTPGLHPEAVEQVLDFFRQLREAGTSIVFITHDMRAGFAVADQLAVMRGGAVDQIVSGAEELTGYGRKLWAAQPANEFWKAL